MEFNVSRELWDRLDNEPERAYRAFQSFLILPGAERTILGAYRTLVGNPHAAKPSDTWSGWAHRFAWRERAAAYDAHMVSLRREAYERGVEEEAERQGVLAERMRAEAFEMLHCTYAKAMDWLQREDFDPKDMNIGHVVQIAKLHMGAIKLFELVNGSEADDTWTEEDDAEFKQLIEEEEAEEDQELSGDESDASGSDGAP